MIIIPARLASTRFSQKILRLIDGEPMFVRTAKNATKADDVIVACDDENVLEIARKYGLRAVMTSPNHASGTDRLNEAASALGLGDDEIIINVQADEPFFEVENLIKFEKFARERIAAGAFMASCYKIVSAEAASDPNLVKVVLASDEVALYFSRSLIPYPRGGEKREYYGHIGIYAYSVSNLKEFCAFSDRTLENTEKLEQLRALSAGKKIAMIKIATNSVGIDTYEDYIAAAEKFNFKTE